MSAASSSRWVSGERRLKAKGDNAVRWRHEWNVVIYEISHATFSAKTSLDKTIKFWLTSIISASLSTVCQIYNDKKSFTVVPIKPWTLEKISGMFIVSRPIRCEMKPQKITDKPQQGSVTTWYETTSCFFFYKKSSIPFGSPLGIFCPQTNTSPLIPSVQKSVYRIDLKVSANCEN